MAPGYKISFPLPGSRSNSSTQTTPGTQPSQGSTSSTHDDSPLAWPGSKAERVLGGPYLESNSLKTKQSRKHKKRLRKLPSFMTVTLADVDNEAVRKKEESPFLGMITLNETRQHSSQAVRRQGSSPLLGDQNGAASNTLDYFSYGSGAQARHTGSSSSLKSYYDKSRTPLLVSQQTSASSARDLALRKGTPQVISPTKLNVSDTYVRSAKPSLPHVRSLSGESKLSAGSKISASSTAVRHTRRRPSLNEPPTLHPGALRKIHAGSPPPAFISTSLLKPMRSIVSEAEPSDLTRCWRCTNKTNAQAAAAKNNIANKHDYGHDEQRSPSMKMNVREPRSGVHYWFDGLHEDHMQVSNPENTEQSQDQSQYVSTPKLSSPVPIQPLDGQPQHRTATSRKSSLSSKRGPSGRKLSFRLDTSYSQGTPNNLPIPAARSRLRSPVSQSIGSGESSKGIPIDLDLQIHSVLNLSSSDDEDGTGAVASAGASSDQQRIRASVETSDCDDEILVGRAQRAHPVRPRPVVNKAAQRRSPKSSKTPEKVPPVPQIPTRHPPNQRNSSLKWRQVKEKMRSGNTGGGGDSTFESGSNGETPLTTLISARSSLSAPREKGSFRGSKLMKVTSEEEKLLEAMRGKRASIRGNEFQKGFNKALALRADPANSQTLRPTTTGAVDPGRDSSFRSSSLYEIPQTIPNSQRSHRKSSLDSISPIPLLASARYVAHKAEPSLTHEGSTKSTSTDALLLEDEKFVAPTLHQASFPFPPQSAPRPTSQLPKPPVGLQIQQQVEIYPSKHSPSLSFGASDVMDPSTPSTGNMPLTPPPTTSVPMLPSLKGSGRTFSGISTKHGGLGMGGERPGYNRKRTASSVVVLDGVEVAAREADEERDIVGWALESY